MQKMATCLSDVILDTIVTLFSWTIVYLQAAICDDLSILRPTNIDSHYFTKPFL